MVCTVFDNDDEFLKMMELMKETMKPQYKMVRCLNDGYSIHLKENSNLFPCERILVNEWIASNNFVEAKTIKNRVVYIPLENIVAIEKIN